MSNIDATFQTVCKKIKTEGREYENRKRGVKRLQIPSYTLRHEFKNGFPAITNKEIYWKGIVAELIWFLNGDNDVEYLNKHGVKIWNKDAYNWYKKHYNGTETDMLSYQAFSKIGKGSVGRNYSVQWRDFQGVDQIDRLITDMMSDIMGSRLKVNAWNPAEIFETALPPCHSEFQVIGVPLDDGSFGFELHWNQRSVDTFLGLPFNIASYALLAKILEQITGFQALAIEGNLKCVHFYDNQYEAVDELLKRGVNTHKNCEIDLSKLRLNPQNWEEVIKALEPGDIELVDYTSDKPIKVEMLAPKDLN